VPSLGNIWICPDRLREQGNCLIIVASPEASTAALLAVFRRNEEFPRYNQEQGGQHNRPKKTPAHHGEDSSCGHGSLNVKLPNEKCPIKL
jgi:hypothetical protein